MEHVFEHDLSGWDDYEFQLCRILWHAANLHDNPHSVGYGYLYGNFDIHSNADLHGNLNR